MFLLSCQLFVFYSDSDSDNEVEGTRSIGMLNVGVCPQLGSFTPSSSATCGAAVDLKQFPVGVVTPHKEHSLTQDLGI